MIARALGTVAVLVVAACQEDLTFPGTCPAFCPGGQPQVRDTVLLALSGLDSTFTGYLGWSEVPSLLVSSGMPAGETRAWIRFERRPDSIFIPTLLQWYPYTIDSVALNLPLTARDSTVTGLTLYFHRLPLEVDTLRDFAWVDERLSDATLVDSMLVPDTVRRGTLRHVLTGDALARFLPPPEDTNVVAIGIRLRAHEPTGIRLTAPAGGGSIFYSTYARVEVADTALRRQQVNTFWLTTGYVRDNLAPPADPTVHFVGRVPAARTVVRFRLPEAFYNLRLQVVRATLELEPAEPLHGLRNDPGELVVYGLARDYGAKSPPMLFLRGGTPLPVGATTTVAVNVFGIVEVWRRDRLTPHSLVISLSPEGGSFHQPVFRSTRSASGAPRLRISYLVPFAVEQP
jgi:hypothetical protein